MADRDLSGRTLGEFRLLEKIGQGGYGAVYRAEQTLMDREVAIKVLHERRRDEVTQRRFLREARLASRLNHPYAAHVYASGVETEDGLLWIAMELVDGVTLADWLKSRGPMPLDQLVAFVGDVAAVIHLAHKRGIIHRDLKPSNIMVIESKDRQIPKLLDFGIAKVLNPELVPEDVAILEIDDPESESPTDERVTTPKQSRLLTPPGAGMGSRDYMSPEQRRDAWSVGPKTDIYSLGVVIYKSLTGRLPFAAERTGEYYELQCHAPVPPLGDNFSPELDRVLQRALANRPEDRHRDVLELVSELQEALRTSKREQLRSSALRWADEGRAPGLLWPRDMLARVKQQVAQDELSGLECSFIADSERRARRIRWLRGLLGALAIMSIFGVLLMRARMAEQQAELQTRLAQEERRTAEQSELEQGRSALLHGEREALTYLGLAYRRGDHSPSTAFMYSRALQPRLAEQALFTTSSGRMWSAAFSPDGRQIVTTDDWGAQVRDAQTYQLLFELPHGKEVYQAVYSADSARLVTVAEDAVRIWDASTGALVHKLTQSRSDRKPSDYFVGAISLDGRLVAAMDAMGSVAHVWDVATSAPLSELHNDSMEFPGLAFSSDGYWLAATGGDEVRVFDTRTWKSALTIRGPRLRSLAFDPTGSRLITGTANGDVAIWAIPSGARIWHLRDVGEAVDAVAFSPNGRLVVAGSRDGTEQVWDAKSGELQSQLNPRHGKILAVEFDRNSKLTLGAGADGTVVVADAVLGMPVTVLEGPQNVVQVAHFDPDSRRVVGASKDGTAWVWDATSPYRRWSSPPIADDCGIGTSAEPDSRFIAAGCRDHATRVWDTSDNRLLAELPSVSHVDGGFNSVFPAVSGTGERAAIARGNTVEVYELPGGRLLRTIVHGAPVNAVAFASIGQDIVSGAVDGSLLITSDNGESRALPASPGGIDAVRFLPDGRVVTSDAQRRLRVYASGGLVLADLEIPARAMSLRSDAAHLVTIPMPPSITGHVASPLLLDLECYRVIALLEGHVGRVFSARWVAGNQILTAGADGTVRIWDGSTGRPGQIYRGGSRFLADATLTSDGLVIAGGADGLLRFWDAPSGRILWTLQAHKSQIIGVHIENGDIVTRGFSGEMSRWNLPSSEQVIGACGDEEHCAILRR